MSSGGSKPAMGERRSKGTPMKRFTLSPEHSAWLAATIERNSRFTGMRMKADEPDPDDKPGPDEPGDKPKDEPSDDDVLGEGGKKAIQAERDRAKAAEDAAKAAKGEFDTFRSALLEGLGIKPDSDDKGEDALKAVQNQLAAIQHESAVLRLANTHKITDEGDLKILASATGAEQMKALAERLAPVQGEPDTKSRRPKADPSQGGGSGGTTDTSGVSHGRDLFKASRSKSS